MKQILLSLIGLSLLSGTAALVTWKIVGPPDRSVSCDPEGLPPHYVCLATVRAWDKSEVLWVDARPRDLWEKDGEEGSVLVNDQENWESMEQPFVAAVFGDGRHLRTKVVVYCNQSGCSSSTYVADKLRENLANSLGFEAFVLEGGVKALRAESAENL